jgi:hypothetical protein
MNRSQQDRLLREVLTGDEVARFRQQSLEHSFLWLQRRRRRRQFMRIGALASAALLATAGLLWIRPGVPQAPPAAASARPPAAATARPPAASAPPPHGVEVKIITDQELFALFPNRPLALIGKPGQQRLVFLDE